MAGQTNAVDVPAKSRTMKPTRTTLPPPLNPGEKSQKQEIIRRGTSLWDFCFILLCSLSSHLLLGKLSFALFHSPSPKAL